MKELEEGEERPLETLEELVEALESDDNGKLDITIKGKKLDSIWLLEYIKLNPDRVKNGIDLNDFLTWLTKGEIGVATTPKRIKTEEEIEAEFKEKNEYIINAPQLDKLDLVEITQSEFIEYIFERDTKLENEVKPFEDERSPEYVQWLAQKRKKVEKIDYSGYLCWRYNPIVFIKQGKSNKHRILLKNDGGDSLDYIESLQLGKNDLAILSPVTYDMYSLKESGQT